ncbi:MAG: hypothetical protein HFE44_15250 [Oscillospiraceae bacterium]|jgi:nitroreductase|nr:hypothetical protein [Oscillospiraceae bacterium]
MNKYAEWIEDMLGAIKESQDPTAICMIESCGKGCAARKNANTAMAELKSAASDCKTRADYVSFLNGIMPAPVSVTEAEDGIIFHLGKSACTCPMASEISQNSDMLKRIAVATSDSVYNMIKVRKNMDFGAETLIMVSSTPAVLPGIEYANAACVLENMVLAATDQKIDSILWSAATAVVKQDKELKKQLGIPDKFNPVLCASFGYAAGYEPPKEHTISTNRIQ